MIKVVIADDHSVVRDGLRFLLEAEGDISVVGGAANGNEAVRLARQLTPDVVIMDVTMPQLNGVEATLAIHEACPTVQVLMLSMHSTAEHIYRALQAGAAGYLLKESAGPEVVAAVRTVHAGRRYLSQKIAETVIDDYIRERRATSPLDSLSRRERQILQLIAAGKSNKHIARQLGISDGTVKVHVKNLLRKLHLRSRLEAAVWALNHRTP